MMNFKGKGFYFGPEKKQHFFGNIPCGMEQSLLIELIRTLLPEEKARVLQFAALDFMPSSKLRAHAIRLLELCFEFSWQDPAQSLAKRAVFERLFPGQDYVDGKLEKIMVESLKMVRSSLLVKHYFREDNDFQQHFDLAKIIRERGLESRSTQIVSRLKKSQEERPFKDATFFQQQFLLEYAIHDEESLHNQQKGDLNVPGVVWALEVTGHLHRLALLNRFLLQQKVARVEAPEFIQQVLERMEVPEEYLEAAAYIRINYEIFRLLSTPSVNPSHARFLFELLLRYEQELDPKSLREFYTYLRNICVIIFTSNVENEEINFMLHDLYKDNLVRGYLHYEGRLHSGTYIAVCSNAIWVKNYEWALEFIEKYRNDVIDENETNDYYRLNMASYLFAVGRFQECLDFIPDTSSSVTYLLKGKRQELKALYELNSDLLSYKLDNFKMFLLRTSPKLLSEHLRKINSDFANLLTQITNSPPGSPKRAELMVKRVQEKKQAAEWRWLLEKAKALKNG
jgi:antitoxin component HigA of HigAB toxin-antitoxin module